MAGARMCCREGRRNHLDRLHDRRKGQSSRR
ncbi:hypothetical protein JMJ77_0014427, partial [Colletotrichum scovillei]